MYSWTCEDLDDLEIYAAERVENPDWGMTDIMYSMMDRAYSCNIIGHFYSSMATAKAAGTAFDSGIIRAARIFANNTLQNLYMQVSITMDTAGNITFLLGYGNGTGWDYVYSNFTVTWAEFSTWDQIDKEFNFLYMRDRNPLTLEGMPNYTGAIYLVMIMGPVEKYVGTWLTPQSPGRPYGRMDYTMVDTGSLTDIPGGAFPCASDDPESRSQQSELVARLVNGQQGKLSMIYRTESDTHFCGVDGNYNPDPDDPRTKDPNEEDPGGHSKPGGGDGGHRRDDNPILLPDLPDLSISDTGMITLYKMSGPDMLDFTSYLFLDITQPGGAWAQMKNLLADPLDFIIGLRAVPLDPASTRASHPKFGTFTWPSAYNEVDQYMSFSCGTVYIEKYYGSCFDYDPYTKIQIFLPGVGFKELPTDDVMGMTIEVTYHIDVFTGDCVAFVHKPAVGQTQPQMAQIIAQFGGNIGASMPLARISYDSAVQNGVSMISKALGFVTNAFTQAGSDSGSKVNAGALVEQTTMNAVQSMKRGVERSGSAGDSVGYMSSQKPYIIRTIPQQSLPENYKTLEGYPANLAGPLTLYKGSGYTTVEAIELHGVSGTDKEKEEILSILKGGVLI